MKRFALILSLVFLSACSVVSRNNAYRQCYAYLNTDLTQAQKMCESPYYLVILVNARHLDYTNSRSLLRTIAKHPSDGSKNGDVGHAWIYLKGEVEGQPVILEGGHSGERGVIQAKYFEGVMNNIDYGCANPTAEQKFCYRFEPNPIKYLWCSQADGFFQEGSGGHFPTFAAKVDITPEQFDDILEFIEDYPYSKYVLTGNQCSTFVSQVAALADFSLEDQVTIQIAPWVCMRREWIRLWEDPRYEMLTFSSPDVLEKSLIEAVSCGCAEDATEWYKRQH